MRRAAFAWRRARALVVDCALLLALCVLLAEALALATPLSTTTAFWLLCLPAWLSYRVPAEALAGATPGKLLFGLRIVRPRSLEPPGVRAALVRTLLRPVDGFPGFYLVGLLCMLVSARGRRLGDLAAGTAVADAEALQRARLRRSAPRHPPHDPKALDGLLAPLGDDAMRVLAPFGESSADRLVVGPCGVVLVLCEPDAGELSLDEDGLRVVLDGEPAPSERDPLLRVRALMAELDHRLNVRPDELAGRANALTLNEILGRPGHHWRVCYTNATLGRRLSSGTLRRHVVLGCELRESIRAIPPLPRDSQTFADAVAARVTESAAARPTAESKEAS